MKKFAAFFVFFALFIPVAVHAQGVERQKLRFAPGASQTVINGVVAGRQTIDYVVNARRGQTMSVRFAPSSGAAFFNLLAPNGEALFVGQSQGNPGRFTARLGATGDYAIRVYLVRSAARRGQSASFRLNVSVTGGGAAVQLPEDPGVADDGGPDFYVVAGLTPGDRLNMRAAPSAAAPVITSYRNGKILRNLGCRRTATQRWCNVENPDRRGERGYVNGRFLRESAAPGRPVRPPQEDALVPGTGFNASGSIDCAIAGFPRVQSCEFGVRRAGLDRATVEVTLPDGDTRVFSFNNGTVRAVSGASSFRYGQQGDDWFLTVNSGQERYTIPDAVVNGG